MEQENKDDFKIVDPLDPTLLNDSRIQDAKKQYHDALIELKEATKGYNAIMTKLNEEHSQKAPP